MASLVNMSGGALIKKKGLLPSGYVQLEYIENTSYAFIDTGLDVGQYNKFGYELKLYSEGGTGKANPFGFAEKLQEYGTNIYQFTISRGEKNGLYRCRFIYNYTISGGDLISSNEPVVISYDGVLIKCNDYSFQVSIPDTYAVNGRTLYLFGWRRYNPDPNDTITHSLGKFYYAKFYYNGVRTRNFIPCKDPNNVVGMYDTVECKFYSSPNGTAFVAGPEV